MYDNSTLWFPKRFPSCVHWAWVSSWFEEAFSFTCHICWALKLMGCFWNMEAGENTAAVSTLKERYLGVGCIYAFYWSISGSTFVNVKLQLECWTTSLNMAGQKIPPHSWHRRKLCHLIQKKNWAERWKHIMFSEEIKLIQSFKRISKEILLY